SYVESPDNTLIVSPDNASRRELNVAVRQELKATGILAPEDRAFRVLVQRQDMTGALSGGVSELGVWLGPVATPDREPSVGESVSLFREPDAGKLPVRFDEREQETGPSQTGLRWCGESHAE